MKNWKYYILAVFIFLFVPEVGARIWLNHIASPEDYRKYAIYSEIEPIDVRYSPHHYLNYYPTPNHKRGKLSHNSLGYRDKEFTRKKPEGVFRIVALGGSTTYSSNVKDNEKTFTAQLENILRTQYGYGKVQVINAGVGGYNSWESLINLQFRVLDLEPDLLIIYHGTNDVHTRLVLPSSYMGDNSGMRKQWEDPPILFWEQSCLLRIIIRKTGFHFNRKKLQRQVGLEQFILSPNAKYSFYHKSNEKLINNLLKNPPVYFRRNLRNMIAIAKEHNIHIIFATWAYSPYFNDYASTTHYQQGFQENNEVVKEVASSHKIPLFDFASVMPQDKKYWSDGRHVNNEGARKKAELFADYLRDLYSKEFLKQN